MRRGGDGDVPLARQHARGDVEPDPACAGQIDFGPGVQVGEIAFDLARAFDRIDVGTQLNEITRDETRREAEVTDLAGVLGVSITEALPDARYPNFKGIFFCSCALRSTRKLTVLSASRGISFKYAANSGPCSPVAR